MMERIEEMFCELCEAEGFGAWWETEGRWEDWADAMVEAGLDADEVSDFFQEMAWEL